MRHGLTVVTWNKASLTTQERRQPRRDYTTLEMLPCDAHLRWVLAVGSDTIVAERVVQRFSTCFVFRFASARDHAGGVCAFVEPVFPPAHIIATSIP